MAVLIGSHEFGGPYDRCDELEDRAGLYVALEPMERDIEQIELIAYGFAQSVTDVCKRLFEAKNTGVSIAVLYVDQADDETIQRVLQDIETEYGRHSICPEMEINGMLIIEPRSVEDSHIFFAGSCGSFGLPVYSVYETPLQHEFEHDFDMSWDDDCKDMFTKPISLSVAIHSKWADRATICLINRTGADTNK
jgi:hypothetical protein